MPDGCYDASGEEPGYPWLDEFLCEYVDGTMDPAARAAFEEYLRGNPELASHVASLCRMRRMLCRYSCQAQRTQVTATPSLPPMPERPVPPSASSSNLNAVAGLSSLLALLLCLGMIADASQPEAPPADEETVYATAPAPSLEAPAQILPNRPIRQSIPMQPAQHGPLSLGISALAATASLPLSDSLGGPASIHQTTLQRTRVHP